MGFHDGWKGPLEGLTRPLGLADADGILARGGTILGSSRTNPYKVDGGLDRIRTNIQDAGIDALSRRSMCLSMGDPDASFVRLATALDLAATARDGGLTFVVAPVRSPDGAVVRRLGRYALALYPWVAGRSGSFNDAVTPEEATELTGLLCSLHAVPHAWNANVGGRTAD